MNCAASILSLDLSPNENCLVVGMTGGYVSMRSQKTRVEEKPVMPLFQPRPGTHRYYQRGQSVQPEENDMVVERLRHKSLAEYERFLRKFQYRNALDAALKV
jgi:U3 small nucleolar RNA-associated protein 15